MRGCYRLLPKYRCTASGLALLSVALFITGWNPSACSALPRANNGADQSKVLETSISRPRGGPPLSNPASWGPSLMASPGVLFRFFQTHPADSSREPICAAKFCGSDSRLTETSKGVPGNRAASVLTRATWESSNFLGALNFSNSNWASAARALASEISFAVSSLYLSSSSFDSEISTLCNRTTAQVAAPAINAKNPAIISDTTMAFSQPWSDKPSIRLTSFEMTVISAIALLLLGFVALTVIVAWDFIRRPKH